MQVAKYWRNNKLRYRLEGVSQNKVEYPSKSVNMKLSENHVIQEKSTNTIKLKADVA